MSLRIGQGIDFHRLEKGLKFIAGGVNIISDKGCVAHSDGDVLIHAICDALLGAAGLGDIGHQFPDNDLQYKGIQSTVLLSRTIEIIGKKGFRVVNIDSTICLEKPRIAPYIEEMKLRLSPVMGIPPADIGIKATTTEKMGFAGREEGVFALAVALLEK